MVYTCGAGLCTHSLHMKMAISLLEISRTQELTWQLGQNDKNVLQNRERKALLERCNHLCTVKEDLLTFRHYLLNILLNVTAQWTLNWQINSYSI